MKLNYSGNGFLKPFPYTIIDDFIDPITVKAINYEWPELDNAAWHKEHGSFQTKYNCQALPPIASQVVNNIDIEALETLTRIPGLIHDPDLTGAGLHAIPRGGFLNMHCDFNVHPVKPWARRVNLLIYLNEDWNENWRGELCLAETPNAEPVKIAPVAGRAVLFETNDKTWHGHPERLECPDGIQRRSLALYYYTEGLPDAAPHSTLYTKTKRPKK